jgi:hypothetical protein
MFLKKSVLIPSGTFVLGLILGGVLLSLFRGSSTSGWRPSSGGGGYSPAKMSDQERRDYERVTTLEKEYAGIKRQEDQELHDANMGAGRLDTPGAGRDRMTAAMGRSEARYKLNMQR